jgi:hypothetical protein
LAAPKRVSSDSIRPILAPHHELLRFCSSEEITMEKQKPTTESIDKKVWAKPRKVMIVLMPTYKKPSPAS